MYDVYVSVNEQFKSSVNLQYDLGNDEKIKQYIPTSDLCDVIKSYLKSSLVEDSKKSTFLAGPYGKGKSYLLLVILYLLSKDKDIKAFKQLVEKIRLIDCELADLIEEINNKNIAYLPVIINNNESDDLNQNFMIALHNSLSNAGIDNLIPQSTFSECLAQIELWENSTELELVKVCEKTVKCSLQQLKDGLNNYDKLAYEKFLNLFECINHGYRFNPLYGNDFASIYASVAKAIRAYGYNGLFVVFDEFGVFLENKTSDFNVKLNKIQAFAEKCNSSDAEGFMQFCCVTHKDIALYQKDKKYSDDFEKISGRFKQIRFDRSLDENYQILCSAIGKKRGYSTLLKHARENNRDFIERLSESAVMTAGQVKFIFENGFPINPMAMYALIQISEKIAQNERTLFTFISDFDLYSFRGFIANNEQGLLNVDYVYDYFRNIIRDNDNYKAIYYKVDALSKIDLKQEDHKIFKAIAICKIIGDEIKFNSKISNIALSLNEPELDITARINDLINQSFLKKNISDGAIDFDVMADAEVNKLLESTIITKVASMSSSELLNKFDNNQYFVSNRYNFENKMVRYFSSIYLETSQFRQLVGFDTLLKQNSGDGVVVNLINDDGMSQLEVEEFLREHESYKIIVRYRSAPIEDEAISKLRRIFAAKILLDNKKETSEVLQESLNLLIEDTTQEIRLYLEKYFATCVAITACDFTTNILKECIYKSLTTTYNNTIVFNNEQVNKNEISPVITKARNVVIDDVLQDKDTDFGKTSAEATIKASFIECITSNDELFDKLTNIFINATDKIKASQFVDMLVAAPYGMRRGVIPLVLAEAIRRLTICNAESVETVLFYNESTEIELTANNLTKMMNNPSKFSFMYKSINKERMLYIQALGRLFRVRESKSFTDNINNVFKSVKSYVLNLEPVIVKASSSDNVLCLSEEELNFKDLFLRYNLNTFDVLFDTLPAVVKVDYSAVPTVVSQIKDNYFNKIAELYARVIEFVCGIFGTKDTNIKGSYLMWKLQHKFIEDIVFDDKFKKIYNALELPLYDDHDMVNALSEAICDSTLEMWNCKKEKTFKASLGEFIPYVQNYNASKKSIKNEFEQSDIQVQLSSLGDTLYSNLQDAIDEYGNALSNAEKIAVLRKLIQKIIY